MGLLDQIMKEQKVKKEKLESGEMLFPEQEKELQESLNINHKRMPTVKQDATLEELLDNFDPETAKKKDIRTLRKALSALSNEKYPKKAKKVKAPKAKPKAKKAAKAKA